MMCNQVRPHLMDYAWRRLSDAEAGAVDRHLAGCDACRAVLEEERALGESLAALPPVAPPRDLWDAVRARRMALDLPTGAPLAIPRVERMRPWRAWTAAFGAAAAVLALMMAPPRPAPEPAPGARVIAQTLDTARQVARQSDDPLADMTDSTWDVLTETTGLPEDKPS